MINNLVLYALSTFVILLAEGLNHVHHKSSSIVVNNVGNPKYEPPENQDDFPNLLPKTEPPEKQEPIWPQGRMPGTYTGKYQGNESFIPCYLSPSADQKIRLQCSPLHVGTYGHYCLHVAEPKLAPYEVEDVNTRKNYAVLLVPGGGGMHIAWDVEGASLARMFQKQGISAFILKYRVPIFNWQLDAYLMDIQRALRMVRGKYSTVGLVGGSFGGAAIIEASNIGRETYSPIDDIDKADYKVDFVVALYPGHPNPEYMKFASIRSPPPTYITVSKDDPCTGPEPSQEIMKDINFLGLNDNKYQLHVYDRGMHGYGNCEYYPKIATQEQCQWPKLVFDWIEEYAGAWKTPLPLITALLAVVSTTLQLN